MLLKLKRAPSLGALFRVEEYGGQLEAEIKRLKGELESIEDEEEHQAAEVLIYELEQEVNGMKEFVEKGRDEDEDLYRVE